MDITLHSTEGIFKLFNVSTIRYTSVENIIFISNSMYEIFIYQDLNLGGTYLQGGLTKIVINDSSTYSIKLTFDGVVDFLLHN